LFWVGLAYEQRRNFVSVGAVGELGEAANAIFYKRMIAFTFGKFDQL
jgi:hypothetical protein